MISIIILRSESRTIIWIDFSSIAYVYTWFFFFIIVLFLKALLLDYELLWGFLFQLGRRTFQSIYKNDEAFRLLLLLFVRCNINQEFFFVLEELGCNHPARGWK